MTGPIVLVIGTRAEAIKLLPVHKALKKVGLPSILCATFQHSDLLQQVLDIFEEKPDFNLQIMKYDQDLFYLHCAIMQKTKDVYKEINPSLVIVHGDTTTTLGAAISAFYMQIPIAHVEAGLRTGNMYSPFPEEMNRKVVGQIATYHFSPTAFATANILSEGVPRENVFCTGNPVVDSLRWICKKIESGEVSIDFELKSKLKKCKEQQKKVILLSAHRRESFNGGLERILEAVKKFASKYSDVEIFYPVHPNPNVVRAVKNIALSSVSNINILPPLSYKDLIYLLIESNFVVTDSGGIQEEAVSIGRRVICLRDVTERWEGVWEGHEKLVGTNSELIFQALVEFYSMGKTNFNGSCVYGDGNASERIVAVLKSKHKLYEQDALFVHNKNFFHTLASNKQANLR